MTLRPQGQNPAAPGSSSVTTQSARLDTSRSFPKFVTGAPQLKVPPSEQLSQQPRRWRPAKTQPSSTRSSKPTARRNASKTSQTRYSAGGRAHQPRVRLAVEKRLLDRLHLLVGLQRYVGWNAIFLSIEAHMCPARSTIKSAPACQPNRQNTECAAAQTFDLTTTAKQQPKTSSSGCGAEWQRRRANTKHQRADQHPQQWCYAHRRRARLHDQGQRKPATRLHRHGAELRTRHLSRRHRLRLLPATRSRRHGGVQDTRQRAHSHRRADL